MKEIKIVIPDFDELLPEEFVEHMNNAAREFLLAMKSLINAKMEKIERRKAAKKIKKVDVE